MTVLLNAANAVFAMTIATIARARLEDRSRARCSLSLPYDTTHSIWENMSYT